MPTWQNVPQRTLHINAYITSLCTLHCTCHLHCVYMYVLYMYILYACVYKLVQYIYNNACRPRLHVLCICVYTRWSPTHPPTPSVGESWKSLSIWLISAPLCSAWYTTPHSQNACGERECVCVCEREWEWEVMCEVALLTLPGSPSTQHVYIYMYM